jgi:acetyltransferase-like isoleucine patch superfamily enzyme
VNSAEDTAPIAARGEPSRSGRDAAGVVAALSAYAYLWTCRRVGARARTLGRPAVANGANVELGDDVVLDSRAGRIELAAGRRGRLAIGHRVRVGPSTRILAAHYVEIGDGTRIGAGCLVSDAGEEEPGAGSEIWIGDGVTLGDGVRVLPGTVIGAGATVAPGAVVSGRIPAGAQVVAAGEPH